jgi:hypothetical protein
MWQDVLAMVRRARGNVRIKNVKVQDGAKQSKEGELQNVQKYQKKWGDNQNKMSQ